MSDEPLITEVQKVETDCLYTSQTNFVQATFYDSLNLLLGVPATLAAAGAAASIITDWSSIAAGVLALIAALLAAVQTFIAPERRATDHKQQGVAYRQLEADARVFRTIDYEGMDQRARRMKLDELLRRRAELNARNRPNNRAFKKAQRKIESGDLSYDVEPPPSPSGAVENGRS
jgi:hypothetical protein